MEEGEGKLFIIQSSNDRSSFAFFAELAKSEIEIAFETKASYKPLLWKFQGGKYIGCKLSETIYLARFSKLELA